MCIDANAGEGCEDTMEVMIERLPNENVKNALLLLEEVFAGEQSIPVELINIKEDLKPIWWHAKIDSKIVGIIASWIENDEWHLGRFAVNSSLRGLGIGKKLIIYALNEMFHLGAETVSMEARDVSVVILKKLGGKVVGEPIKFYDGTVTPMVLNKKDFLNSIS